MITVLINYIDHFFHRRNLFLNSTPECPGHRCNTDFHPFLVGYCGFVTARFGLCLPTDWLGKKLSGWLSSLTKSPSEDGGAAKGRGRCYRGLTRARGRVKEVAYLHIISSSLGVESDLDVFGANQLFFLLMQHESSQATMRSSPDDTIRKKVNRKVLFNVIYCS